MCEYCTLRKKDTTIVYLLRDLYWNTQTLDVCGLKNCTVVARLVFETLKWAKI